MALLITVVHVVRCRWLLVRKHQRHFGTGGPKNARMTIVLARFMGFLRLILQEIYLHGTTSRRL